MLTTTSRENNVASDFDLLILTALTEEYSVVLSVMARCATALPDFRGLAMFEYRTDTANLYRIGVASAHDSGAVSMGTYASKLLGSVTPACMVLLGFAASAKPDDLGLADLPVASEVFSYDDIAIEDGKLTFRPHGFQVDTEMRRAASELRSRFEPYRRWQDKCRTLITEIVPEINEMRRASVTLPLEIEAPHMTVDRGAGGPFLVRDAKFMEALSKGSPTISAVHPKLAWVEMEAHGFMKAAAEHTVPAIVMKGISDNGDAKKAQLEKETGGFFRVYACQNATIALLYILNFNKREPLILIQPSQGEDAESRTTWLLNVDEHREALTFVHGDGREGKALYWQPVEISTSALAGNTNAVPRRWIDEGRARLIPAPEWIKPGAQQYRLSAEQRLVIYREPPNRPRILRPGEICDLTRHDIELPHNEVARKLILKGSMSPSTSLAKSEYDSHNNPSSTPETEGLYSPIPVDKDGHEISADTRAQMLMKSGWRAESVQLELFRHHQWVLDIIQSVQDRGGRCGASYVELSDFMGRNFTPAELRVFVWHAFSAGSFDYFCEYGDEFVCTLSGLGAELAPARDNLVSLQGKTTVPSLKVVKGISSRTNSESITHEFSVSNQGPARTLLVRAVLHWRFSGNHRCFTRTLTLGSELKEDEAVICRLVLPLADLRAQAQQLKVPAPRSMAEAGFEAVVEFEARLREPSARLMSYYAPFETMKV